MLLSLDIEHKIMKKIRESLVAANIKLRHIERIKLCETYSPFTRSNKPILTIESLRHSDADSIREALKDYPYKIEIEYLGEYSGNNRVPKNIWVKMSSSEQQEHLSRKDSCEGCAMFNEKCNVITCPAL